MVKARQVPTLSMSDYLGSQNTERHSEDKTKQKKRTFVDELYAAIAEYGFVVIKDHGISSEQIEKAYQLSKQLFDLPQEIKAKYESGDGQRGYISFGKEVAKGHKDADLKEYWHVGPEFEPNDTYADFYPGNKWPTEVPEFRSFFCDFYERLNSVAVDLLCAIGEALSLPKDYFQLMINKGNSVQRLIHYPAISTIGDEGLESVSENSVRAAAHVDINLITLLIGATDSGLELLDKNGEWLPVHSKEGEIVVDTGDMMARLTNNTLPATMHRVVNPQDLSRPRYSIPYFVHPRNEISLASLEQFGEPKFPPILAGEFLQERLNENGFGKK